MRKAGRPLVRRKPQRQEERGWLAPALRALSVEIRLQNFFSLNHCYCQLEGTFESEFSLKTSYTVSCIFSSYLSSTTWLTPWVGKLNVENRHVQAASDSWPEGGCSRASGSLASWWSWPHTESCSRHPSPSASASGNVRVHWSPGWVSICRKAGSRCPGLTSCCHEAVSASQHRKPQGLAQRAHSCPARDAAFPADTFFPSSFSF